MDDPNPHIASTIVMRAVTDLVPYARNPRTHDEAQVGQLAASISEFGFTNPVLVDEDGGIIAGHGRVMAAQRLGLPLVPTIELAYLTPEQRRAYVIADNKLALNAGWDEALLRLELSELRDAGYDVDLTGFLDAEVAELFAESDGEGSTRRIGNLADKFGVPPFSVLTARDGWWQGRKDAWIAFGIQSEVGRGDMAVAPGGGLMPSMTQTRKTGKTERGDSRGRPIVP